MATTTVPQSPAAEQTSNPLARLWDRSYTLNWEVVVYVVIFLLAVFTRFHNLGDRVMSHDESLHTRFSWNLYADGNFQHTPLMHGPILFHVTALSYSIFGDSDFSARLYPAVLGVIITVFFPLLFRRWLGNWGAVLVAVMLLASPLLMYYNRYIRHDTPSIFFGLMMLYGIMMYLDGPDGQRRRPVWLVLLSIGMIGNLGSKETSFIYIAIFWIFVFMYWLVRLAQRHLRVPGKTAFYMLMLGILLGGVASMGMYIILDITPLEQVNQLAGTSGWFSNIETRSFLIWTFLVILATVSFAVGTLLWVFRNPVAGSRAFSKVFLELLIIIVIAVVTTLGLIVIEELSHVRAAGEVVSVPVVPGEEGGVLASALSIRWFPIVAAWGVGAVAILVSIGMLVTGIWRRLRELPEFDILIVMGALILPWATAIVIVAAGGTEQDYTALGLSLPGWLAQLMPGQSPMLDGQFIVGALAWVPFMATAMAVGFTWNWRVFAVCFAVFHAIFAFFFTTMFTNPQGLATGMVYSLQYWLEQQEVRRGGQPQYYYLLIIMPVYEFLPIIGSVFAMLSGLGIFWRFRRDRLVEDDRQRVIEHDALQSPQTWDGAEIGDQPPMMTVAPSGYAADAFATSETAEGNVTSLDALLVEAVDEDGEDLYEKPKREYDPLESPFYDARPASRPLPQDLVLERPPFLIFVAWWAVLNLIGYSLAGEKMPWLGTHLTLPLILLSGWYFGQVFEQIDWGRFVNRRGWMYLFILPFMGIILTQVVYPFIINQPPFSSLQRQDLIPTYSWIALVVLAGGLIYLIYWLIEQSGWQHFRQMVAFAAFGLLAVLTLRFALLASFINHDLATEYLVYAHAAPAVKEVLDEIDYLSRRTTDGNDMRIVYDNEVSWPYSWYFRNYDNALFIGANPTVQNIDGAVVILVGEANRYKLEPLLNDQYYHFTNEDGYIRLWWPMQEYFNLSAQRVINIFDLSPENTQAPLLRQGILDIWWARDYTTYGQAVDKDFTTENWPVADRMHFYVRKDIASEIWSLGVGEGSARVGGAPAEPNICVDNWQELAPIMTFGTFGSQPGQLNRPLDLAIDDENGIIYVAEENAARISAFDMEGNFLFTFGELGRLYGQQDSPYFGLGNVTETGGVFYRPNSIFAAPNGNLYVVDTWNHRIQRFDSDRNWITAWGSEGLFGIDVAPEGAPTVPEDGFYGPRDVVVQNGVVYVADTGNNRVRTYDLQGNFIRDIGRSGTGFGQLLEPSSVVVDRDTNLLYVAEWNNRRISIFGADGSYQTSIPFPGWRQPSGNRAYMAIDSARDMLYVTDPDVGRITVFDTNGSCLGAFGQLSTDAVGVAQFTTIGGITVDADGFVYIADASTGQIVKLPPFPRPPLPADAQAEVTENAPITEEADAAQRAETDEVTEEGVVETTPETSLEAEASPEASEALGE